MILVKFTYIWGVGRSQLTPGLHIKQWPIGRGSRSSNTRWVQARFLGSSESDVGGSDLGGLPLHAGSRLKVKAFSFPVA